MSTVRKPNICINPRGTDDSCAAGTVSVWPDGWVGLYICPWSWGGWIRLERDGSVKA